MKCVVAFSLFAATFAYPTRFLTQSAETRLEPITASFLEESELAHKRAEEAHERAEASKIKYLEAIRKLSADKQLFDKEKNEYAEKAEEERKEADAFAQKLSIVD